MLIMTKNIPRNSQEINNLPKNSPKMRNPQPKSQM